MNGKVRVLVVDDSAYSRRTITKMLEDIPEIEVAGYAVNGEEGIQKTVTLKPDLVTLDLEMPKMDGFTLLRILTTRFSLPVIVVSALSSADKVFKALELGALDFVAKPSGTASAELLSISDDLHNKVLQVLAMKPGIGKRNTMHRNIPATPAKNLSLRGKRAVDRSDAFDIVAIGSSTGGPPALQGIFSAFEKRYPFSIVVAQHMPSGFTKAFAERLNRASHFTVKEAGDGDPVVPGEILIAPGGKNLVMELRGGHVSARVVMPAKSDRYIPSVDVMLDSCAPIYKNRMLAVILTGMGNDGSRGVRIVKDHGGYVIAESEETSVVYGMPREAVATGVVDRVLPLDMVAKEIIHLGNFS